MCTGRFISEQARFHYSIIYENVRAFCCFCFFLFSLSKLLISLIFLAKIGKKNERPRKQITKFSWQIMSAQLSQKRWEERVCFRKAHYFWRKIEFNAVLLSQDNDDSRDESGPERIYRRIISGWWFYRPNRLTDGKHHFSQNFCSPSQKVVFLTVDSLFLSFIKLFSAAKFFFRKRGLTYLKIQRHTNLFGIIVTHDMFVLDSVQLENSI